MLKVTDSVTPPLLSIISVYKYMYSVFQANNIDITFILGNLNNSVKL